MFGAFFMSLFAGTLSDRFGRKCVIVLADVLLTLGALLMAFANSINMLVFGRLIIGLGVGLASPIVPVYISELVPNEMRGSMVAINGSALVFGQFASSVICLLLGDKWRIMLGLAAIPSLAQLICMIWMPESPRWLAK